MPLAKCQTSRIGFESNDIIVCLFTLYLLYHDCQLFMTFNMKDFCISDLKVAEVSFLLLLLSQLLGLVLKSFNEPMLPKINTTMAALVIYGVKIN